MIKVNEITKEKLYEDQIFEQITDLVSYCIDNSDYREGRDLLEKLRSLINHSETNEFKRYNELISKIELLVLHTLSDKEAINLFSSKLLYGLSNNIIISNNLKLLFIFYQDDLNDFQLHSRLAQAIASNQELLGQNKIQIKTQDKLQPQTIENWMKNFSSSLSIEKVPTYLEEAEFLNSNNNVKRLNHREKELLKNLLRIYNSLRYPLRDSGQVKETGHQLVGKKLKPREDIEIVGSNENPLASLKQRYNNYRRARWDVLRIEDEVLVQTKGDITAIKKELSSAARDYNKNRLIACVKILARQGYLLDALAESPAWLSSLGEYIISKYAAQSEPDQISMVVSELKYNYKNPAIISEFLQYLLIEKLKISHNESALTAIEISQLLGSEYEKIAFGNQETGNFEWAKNKVTNSQLVMEE